MQSTYLTTLEVAEMLRCHRTTVQRMIENGQLPGSIAIRTRNRKSWRIPRSALDQLAASSISPQTLAPIEKVDLVRDPYPDLKRFCKSAR